MSYDSCCVITGPVLVGTARAIFQVGHEALINGARTIDLSGVTETDSAGIAVVLAWLREAKQQNAPLQLLNIPASLRSLAAVYGVSDLIPE